MCQSFYAQERSIFMSKKRNAQGAGTIRQRPDGRWEARYTVGRDGGTGKQIQKSVYGKTQKEVLKKLRQVSVDIENGVYTEPSKLTVGQWLDIWLDEYTGNLKPHTVTAYKSLCNTHLKPTMGAIKLTALSTPVIQKTYNALHKGRGNNQPLSAKTIRNLNGVFHKSMEQAVKIGYIRHNPCNNCTLPKVTRKEITPLDDTAIKRFISACEGEIYKTLYITTLFTGMRQGEVLGLRWDNIDFDNGIIYIVQQLQRKKADIEGELPEYYFASLKNNKPRKIMPAPYVMQLLKEHKKHQNIQRLKAGIAWGNGDSINNNLVFTDETGQHLKHRTVYNHYKAIVRKLGLENSRFHDLRHSYAVASLQNGDDIKTVQENLGHHTAAFTLDVYGHVTEKMRKKSAENMNLYINSLL